MPTDTHQNQAVIIRLAAAADDSALQLLAELDSAPQLSRPALIAELRGQAVAALALSDRRAIANPFLPTRDVVDLLRLRGHQISEAASGESRRRLARWTSTAGKPIGHAGDRLHRFLKRADATVERLNRVQQPLEHRR